MRNKRNIIIPAAVIIFLAAGTAALLLLDTDKQVPETEGTASYTVYSEEASSLAEVLVKTADTEIKAVNTGKSEWTINDLPSDEIDKNKAYSLAGTVSTIISKNKFEAAPDLSQYGLDNPSITVIITKKNGEEDTLYIGDMSPTLGEYFIRLDGSDDVYTMFSYKVDTLLKPVAFYMEFNRFKIDIDDITDVKIERADGTIEIKLIDKIDENTNNVWEMVSPYTGGANDDYIDNKILAPIEEIALTEPVDSDGGIDSNSPIITLTIKPYDNATGKYGEEYAEVLTVGKTEGDITYVRYKDRVYRTSSQSVGFVNDSAFNIVSKMHALVDISLVKSVTVEYGGENHTIDITPESGNKYSFKLDGHETDAKVSQEIYRSIIGLAVDAVYDGSPAGETLLKVTYEGIKHEDDSVVEIKRVDDLNCVMEKNGRAEFTIKKSKIDEFINLFNAYADSNA